jgi:ubiquinone/menaquinone biosynthesis C-methylase UbiE
MPKPELIANADLKEQVRQFWNQQSCDTQVAASPKFSREYFEEIETFRYRDQPFIHSFAQFTRYRGRRVLEVGFGAGTDFIQWLRAGALASGIDLTPEALDNLSHRIEIYNLPKPERICVGDAEKLPFPPDSFDLGYSFGVLHLAPDTPRAIGELVRVIRPGGELKIMVYNRRSIYAINQWIKHALLKARPWKSIAWVLFHYMESLGTKAYTRRELRRILSVLPLEDIQIHTEITSGDYLSASAFPPLRSCNRFLLRCGGYFQDWTAINYVERGAAPKSFARPANVRLTGNPFGFYHCITAVKSARSSGTPASQPVNADVG